MSDSEDSTVTYTEVSSPFEDLSYIGSSRVDVLPMMPHDPYAYVKAALQALQSPDYVPGYIPESDLKEDHEKDSKEDDEDLEEDPADYPTDRDDDDDVEEEEKESFEDDSNDEEEDENEDKRRRSTQLWLTLLRAKAPSTSHPPPLLHTKASMAMLRAVAPSTYILTPRLKTPPSGTPPLLPIPLPTSSPPLLLPIVFPYTNEYVAMIGRIQKHVNKANDDEKPVLESQ
nr:hypothetical protein [Tanacetum cinerariifolium]